VAAEQPIKRIKGSLRGPITAADPPRRRLRYLAWLAALVLALLAWYEDPSWSLRIAAAAVFAIGTVLPHTFRLPYRALRAIFRAVGFRAGAPDRVESQGPRGKDEE